MLGCVIFLNKPMLLYASPFWPQKSGISEYSEVLIHGLAKYFDITLLVDNYRLENKNLTNSFSIVNYKENAKYPEYDYIIYNFGNQPDYHGYMYEAIQNNPGYIILHDFVLFYLTVGFYQNRSTLFQKIYEMEGVNGIQVIKASLKELPEQNLLLHKSIAAQLPLNKEIIEAAQGIFVNSDYSKKRILQMKYDANIFHIKMVHMNSTKGLALSENYVGKLLFNIPSDAYVVGSVGFIAPSKQNELTCQAVKLYNKTYEEKIYYLMIGEGNYVDNYLDSYIIKTGFLPKEQYWQAISRCDLVFNLRYPTNGETSATLIQCMGLGKLCVVTDIGWFDELPDDTVIKIPYNITPQELAKEISNLIIQDTSTFNKNAKDYVNDNCDPKIIARNIFDVLTETSLI